MVQREEVFVGYSHDEKEIVVDPDCCEVELNIFAANSPSSRIVRIRVAKKAKDSIHSVNPSCICQEDGYCGA